MLLSDHLTVTNEEKLSDDNDDEVIACSLRLGDVDDYMTDSQTLCQQCQVHKCSSYCMRRRKGRNSKKPRYCRAGAGEEKNEGRCDTEGFTLRASPSIVHDERNFLKLEMPRNNIRLHQTSLNLLRGWRGNCDMKILLYCSPNGVPDPEDIAAVTDYVVAYCCKGNETLAVEKETLKDFILK